MSEKPTYEELEQRLQELEQAESELKTVDNGLRESEEKYHQLFELESDAIFLIEKDTGRILEANKSATNLYGFSREELLRMKNVDLSAESDKTKQATQGQLVLIPIRYHRKKDGTVFPVEITASHLNWKGQEAHIAAIRDITFRVEAESVLRESEKRYRSLFDSSRDAIMTLAPPTWLFTSGNPATVELFRVRDEAEFISHGPWQLSPERQPHGTPSDEKAREMIETAIRNGSHFFEWTHCYSDGTPFAAEVLLTRMEQNDQVLLQATVRDITERKRLEEELLRAQKLESVGLLAGGIAHDFNNILTTILGNVSMAKNQVKSGDDIFDLLNEVEMASTRAQTLTKQLLTFAKGGAPVKETASIKDILKESPSFVLRGSKSQCEFSIAEDLWTSEVDVGQISQVINNIVINANQAMPEGGVIHVAAENLITDNGQGYPFKPGRYIKLSFKDQGVGIAKEHLSNIFDPYFTTKDEGSGLGLATTYSIIKNHDGHITAESQVGVGTTFYIYLPASDKAVPEKEEVKLIKGQGRILVMDDEASLRKMLGRMLGNLGYESEFAKDGTEAIRMVKEAKETEKPYDAVILDLNIPGGMGGKEAIGKLLEIDHEVKAIVSSGYSDDPVLSNFQEYGFKGMMPKPFESRSLGKVLHEVLRGEKKEGKND